LYSKHNYLTLYKTNYSQYVNKLKTLEKAQILHFVNMEITVLSALLSSIHKIKIIMIIVIMIGF